MLEGGVDAWGGEFGARETCAFPFGVDDRAEGGDGGVFDGLEFVLDKLGSGWADFGVEDGGDFLDAVFLFLADEGLGAGGIGLVGGFLKPKPEKVMWGCRVVWGVLEGEGANWGLQACGPVFAKVVRDFVLEFEL